MSSSKVLSLLALLLEHAFAAHHTSFAHLAATTDTVTGVNADGSTAAIDPADFSGSLANGVVGITNAAGFTWLLTGTTAGNQMLSASCLAADGTTTIAEIPISPSRVNLRCLSSGPGGVYAFNQRSNNIGTIDVATGMWSPIARLPGPYDSLILAGDDMGKVQYINGAGERYEDNGTSMVLVATGFPTATLAQCGEFDEPNHINSASIGGLPTQGIQRTNINNQNVKRLDTVPGFIASDITTGGFQMCPTPTPTSTPTFFGKKGGKGKKGAKGAKGAKKMTPAPTPAPTPSPSSSPSATPSPSSSPSATPSSVPSSTPSVSGSAGVTSGVTGGVSASASSGSSFIDTVGVSASASGN